jgi:TolB-like protein/tetratricopeptide (TPR) repeat protein/DNA-binding winged helix-turn-helix (wHTH) protein
MQVETVIESNDALDRSAILRKGFRMGEWIVKPVEGVIDGLQGSRHLQPKSMDVLLCLASSPNDIVERDQLIEQVWGRRAITDEPLTRCIHEIRRELNDTCDKPVYIQTIPKRGYRLIAPVELADEDALKRPPLAANENERVFDADRTKERLVVQLIKRRVVWVGVLYALVAWVLTRVAVQARTNVVDGVGAPDWLLPIFITVLFLGFPVAVFLGWAYEVAGSSKPAGSRGRQMFRLLYSRRGIDLVVITLLLSVLAGMAMDLRPGSPVIAAFDDSVRVGVLPFRSEQDEPADNWLGKGLAEDLMNMLSRVKHLEVAAWTSSFRAFPAEMEVREIGRELNVHYLLTGDVKRERDSLSVHAHAFDAQTGLRLWSETYEGSPDDWFDIQEKIAQRVVAMAEISRPIEAGGGSMARSVAVLPAFDPPTTSTLAYDNYLVARDRLQHPESRGSLQAAAQHFTQAIQYDIEFAAAYAGLCTTMIRQMAATPGSGSTEMAESICRQAVDLDPASIDSRTVFADFQRVTGQSREALAEYQWIVGQRPRAVEAHLGIGGTYANLAEYEKADQAYRRAIEIKPDYVDAYVEYGEFLFDQGRYREAVEIGRQLIQLDPESVTGYIAMGEASFARGRFETAIAAFREVIRLRPTSDAYSNIGAGYYYLGRYRAAIRMFNRAAELAPLDHRAWGELGDAYSLTGEDDADALVAYSKARDLAQSAQQLRPDDPVMAISLAYYCAAMGDRACASLQSSRAVALAPASPKIHYYRALVNMRFGEEAAAISAAERALALGYPRALLSRDPFLESVRHSPRLAGIPFGQPAVALNTGAVQRNLAIFP